MPEAIDIKEVRTKLKLSQQEFADALGIPRGRINAWEQRGTKPKLADYIKIQMFLENEKNVPSEKLKSETENKVSDIITIQTERLESKRRWLADKDRVISHLEKEIEYLESDKDKMREHFEREIADKDKTIARLESYLDVLVTERDKTISHLENEIKLLEEKLAYGRQVEAKYAQLPCVIKAK